MEVASPVDGEVHELQLVAEPRRRPSPEHGRTGFVPDVRGGEDALARELALGWHEVPMKLDPHAAPWMDERRAVVVRLVERVRSCRARLPAELSEQCFDGRSRVVGDEQIDIAHQAKVRRWIVLLADRDALEQRHRETPTLTRIEDVARGVEQLPGHDALG